MGRDGDVKGKHEKGERKKRKGGWEGGTENSGKGNRPPPYSFLNSTYHALHMTSVLVIAYAYKVKL